MATFANIQARYNLLIGEDTTTTADSKGQSHINQSIQDILNKYPYSWSVKSTDLTLSGGSANLPSDFNPLWHLVDARITQSSTGDDNIFTEITIDSRDSYDTDSYVYWITQATPGTYVFNSLTQEGTVTIYYHYVPDDMDDDADVCIVPDMEAVAYLAASKNWIGDERNTELKREYEQEAGKRVQEMYTRDLSSGAHIAMKGISSLNG